MKHDKKPTISRREFFKAIGVAGMATAGWAACSDNGKKPATEAGKKGEMTYRTNSTTGDKVSLLGYGCMRWPMKPSPDGKGEVVD